MLACVQKNSENPFKKEKNHRFLKKKYEYIITVINATVALIFHPICWLLQRKLEVKNDKKTVVILMIKKQVKENCISCILFSDMPFWSNLSINYI